MAGPGFGVGRLGDRRPGARDARLPLEPGIPLSGRRLVFICSLAPPRTCNPVLQGSLCVAERRVDAGRSRESVPQHVGACPPCGALHPRSGGTTEIELANSQATLPSACLSAPVALATRVWPKAK